MWEFSASVTVHHNPTPDLDEVPWSTWPDDETVADARASLENLGSLNANGKVYALLADNTSVLVTPQIKGVDDYSFWQPTPREILPVLRLAVDMNRDGGIDFDTNGPDATSTTNPYCFWLNNNHDGFYMMDSQYSVQDDLGGNADAGSTTITCTRDLEDYTRVGINVQGISQHALTNGFVKIRLESAGPQVQVYPAVAGAGTAYLTDAGTAQEQISAPNNTAFTNNEIPPSFWVNNYPTAFLLFDGISGGSGTLKATCYNKDGQQFGDSSPPVYVNLQDVKSMYETWTVGDGNGGTPTSTATQLYQCTAAAPELNQYILFVHGWNLNSTDKDQFANTAFKRLWWQNYKGRFGAFRWPTTFNFNYPISVATDARNFDNGEFAAWQSAAGLAAKLNDLNSLYPGNVYLFAHSMGNVVAGEALKLNNGIGNGVTAYVACQAAIAAHAYAPSTGGWTPYIGSFNTPDSLAAYPTTNDPCYFNGVTSGGSRANFFNQKDFALTNWVTDQRFKPDNGVAFPGYFYDSSHQPTGYFYIAGSQDYDLYFPGDRYKIFAYCVQNPCYALGATAGDVGGFSGVDLTAGIWPQDQFDNHNYSTHPWHSAEFLFSTVEQSSWWQNLMGAFFPH